MINTNLPPILYGFQISLWLIIGQIFASERGVPHFNALARGDPRVRVRDFEQGGSAMASMCPHPDESPPQAKKFFEAAYCCR